MNRSNLSVGLSGLVLLVAAACSDPSPSNPGTPVTPTADTAGGGDGDASATTTTTEDAAAETTTATTEDVAVETAVEEVTEDSGPAEVSEEVIVGPACMATGDACDVADDPGPGWQCLDDGADGRARVIHHGRQAVRHLVGRVRAAAAPGVKRVDGRKFGVEN